MKKLLFLAITLIAFACNSDDDSTPTDPELTVNSYLLKKTYLNDELFSERVYSSDSILLRINNYREDTIWFYTAYEYIGDTIMTSFRSGNGDLTNYRKTFELPDNTVRTDRFDNDGTFKNTAIYSYESGDDCGYSKLEFFDSNGMVFRSEEVAFTDDNCSNTASFLDENAQIESTIQTIRDDKHIFLHFPRIDMLRLNKLGSITAYNVWNEDGVLEEENSYTAEIEYNDADYPTMITRNYLDGSTQVYTYEY